ncbi:uncharacterized protein LY89DRAFT_723039 [Mollisia scopiformis]|uniref:F-box domain-containing protein n=1 Tax=Mollisia scopiformis TaxID=149040 RepID=A0A194WU43_MOLSC|nr:uncharacterized protein LY89DRAFT_723039 [Mollisia scopiformis]KUJ11199.1 hypothetical protein LY89DRAFT_723039 [Mollisia scopiformis]
MELQIHDFISKLPEECKSAVVRYLAGKDAANLRLTSRAWRDTAAEGLFNVGEPYGNCEECITRGVLVFRPHRTSSYFINALSKWPWLARHIKEIEIYLPDKRVQEMVAALDHRTEMWKEELDSSWPKYRLQNLGICRKDLYRMAESFIDLFSHLTHVESVSAFSERCPFPESEKELCAFWDYLCPERFDPEPSFPHRYQDEPAAIHLFIGIFRALKYLKSPINRLSLEHVPLSVFEILHRHQTQQAVDRSAKGKLGLGKALVVHPFESTLSKVRDLHIGLVVDSVQVGPLLPVSKQGAFFLKDGLGFMSSLKSLTMIWSDMDDASLFGIKVH